MTVGPAAHQRATADRLQQRQRSVADVELVQRGRWWLTPEDAAEYDRAKQENKA